MPSIFWTIPSWTRAFLQILCLLPRFVPSPNRAFCTLGSFDLSSIPDVTVDDACLVFLAGALENLPADARVGAAGALLGGVAGGRPLDELADVAVDFLGE